VFIDDKATVISVLTNTDYVRLTVDRRCSVARQWPSKQTSNIGASLCSDTAAAAADRWQLRWTAQTRTRTDMFTVNVSRSREWQPYRHSTCHVVVYRVGETAQADTETDRQTHTQRERERYRSKHLLVDIACNSSHHLSSRIVCN